VYAFFILSHLQLTVESSKAFARLRQKIALSRDLICQRTRVVRLPEQMSCPVIRGYAVRV